MKMRTYTYQRIFTFAVYIQYIIYIYTRLNHSMAQCLLSTLVVYEDLSIVRLEKVYLYVF